MAEEAHDSSAPVIEPKKAEESTAENVDMESRITIAMLSRVGHFKEQSDSLTFEGVRRLLEKDMGLETLALDVHKRFVKQCLLKDLGIMAKTANTGLHLSTFEEGSIGTKTSSGDMGSGNGDSSSFSLHLTTHRLNGKNYLEWAQSVKLAIDGRGKLGFLTGEKCLDDAKDDGGSKSSGETVENNVSTTTEGTKSPKGRQSKKDIKEPCSEDENLEESPVLGLLSGNKTMKTENKEKNEVSESTIKNSIRNRASYVEANSDKVTMAGLRRLLEEDLKLDKNTLDPYKKFIAKQLDEVLKSREVSAYANEVKKKNLKKKSQSKTSKKVSKKVNSASSGSEKDEEEGDEDEDDDDEEDDEEEVKAKKNITPKGRMKNTEGLKKRKIPKKEAQMPDKKRRKHAESNSDDKSDEEDSGSVSDDGRSRSSAANAMKKKETSTPVYRKRVEHLKSVIKSCGMSVPPSIYKRVKQVPENKREAQLVKELEEILSNEGLSANPSEKEIKDVKKKKDRARELEGIDMSNIVSSSRRRSATSFVPPPKPKIPELSDDESEESDEDDGDDDDEDNDDEEAGNDGNSQSEESEEGEDGDSD